jgi:hypothetical protein
MTTYSVFDVNTKRYSYYEGTGPGGTHAGTPPIRAHADIGATPDQAAWIVPVGARKVGSGELPKGRIASFGGGGALGDFSGDGVVKAGVVGFLAYLAWKAFR